MLKQHLKILPTDPVEVMKAKTWADGGLILTPAEVKRLLDSILLERHINNIRVMRWFYEADRDIAIMEGLAGKVEEVCEVPA